jgi:hypothetical protein
LRLQPSVYSTVSSIRKQLTDKVAAVVHLKFLIDASRLSDCNMLADVQVLLDCRARMPRHKQ